jgi:hypothetical protein
LKNKKKMVSTEVRNLVVRARYALVELIGMEEGEFSTITGFTKSEVRAWNPPTDQWSIDDLAIARTILNTISGYPHLREMEVSFFLAWQVSDIRSVIDELKSEEKIDDDDFD